MKTWIVTLLLGSAAVVNMAYEVKPESDAATMFAYSLIKSKGKSDFSDTAQVSLSSGMIVTMQQLDKIKELVKDTGLGKEWATGYLKSLGVETFGSMTYNQAVKLVEKLEKYKQEMDGYRKRHPETKQTSETTSECANGSCGVTRSRWFGR